MDEVVYANAAMTTEQMKEAVLNAAKYASRDRNVNRLISEPVGENRRMAQQLIDSARRHADCGFDNFVVDENNSEMLEAVRRVRAYTERIKQNFRDGNSLILIGKPGTGKDHLLMAVAKAAMVHGYWVKRTDGDDFRERARDVAMNPDSIALRELKEVDILWMSDPRIDGAEPSGHLMAAFYAVFNRRYDDMLPTIMSINAPSRELIEKAIGTQVYDRLRDKATVVACTWESYRKTLG